MKNNLNYVNNIMNEIDKDSAEGTKKAISDFMKKVDIMGFVLLKKEFRNYPFLLIYQYCRLEMELENHCQCYLNSRRLNSLGSGLVALILLNR